MRTGTLLCRSSPENGRSFYWEWSWVSTSMRLESTNRKPLHSFYLKVVISVDQIPQNNPVGLVRLCNWFYYPLQNLKSPIKCVDKY